MSVNSAIDLSVTLPASLILCGCEALIISINLGNVWWLQQRCEPVEEGECHMEQPDPVGDKQELPLLQRVSKAQALCLAQGHSEAFCKALPGNPGVSIQPVQW